MTPFDLKALPPAKAVEFLRAKGYATSFNWRDMWQEEHGRAFTVAKVMRLDILQDIRQSVDKALAEGTTFRQFQAELTPTLQAKGWWGRQSMLDPATGKEQEVQLGSPRRLKTIYDTNLRMARSAGRWEAIERNKERRPYLRYVAVMDSRTRHQHAEWHNTILPADDPWWETHYPPNGWNCRCMVQQLSARDLERYGLTPTETAPPDNARPYINRRTGEVTMVPRGIDPGFAYNVGKSKFHGVTPPPIDGPPTTSGGNPPAGPAPMPMRRQVPESSILPSGTSTEDAMGGFLQSFGATADRPALFTDKIGEPIFISKDFFTRDTGQLKLAGQTRIRAVPLLAETIKNPDEIWWLWEKHGKAGEYRLRRRYIARYEVAGRPAPVMVVMDVGKDGWTGVTAFRPTREEYLMRHRAGTLAYRRKD